MPLNGVNKSRRQATPSGGNIPTEDAFIAAATHLFAELGYKDTSIAHLARELNLTSASLYYYVTGKQALLARVLQTGMFSFLDRLENIANGLGSERTKVALAVQNHIDFVLNHREVVSVFFRYRHHLGDEDRQHYEHVLTRYESIFTDLLRSAMDAGELVREDPVLLRLYVLGMINSSTQWFRPDGRLTLSAVQAHMSHMIMDRLLPQS